MKKTIKLLFVLLAAVLCFFAVSMFASAAGEPSIESVQVTNRNSNSITINWITGKEPVSFVKIYKYKIKDKSNTLLAKLKKGENTYTVSNLLSGTDYCFKIKAYYKNGSQTVASKAKTVYSYTLVPGVTNLRLVSCSDTEQTISWDTIRGINTYRIYYLKYSTGEYVLLGTKNTNTAVLKCNPGTKYTYKVQAIAKVDSGKKTISGKQSDPLEIMTKSAFISTLNASNVTDSSITLSWAEGKNATGYNIYQYSPAEKKYKAVRTVQNASSATFNYLKSAKTYKFKIKSYTVVDGMKYYGDSSSVLKVSTKPYAVAVKQENDSRGNGKAVLSWTEAPRAKGYLIYVSDHMNSGFNLYSEVSADYLHTTLTGLKNDAAQYVKIKAYFIADGVKVYGDYSAVITVNA